MARFQPPTLGDNLKGMWRSFISGHGMRPVMTYRHIRDAQAERLAREAEARSKSGGWLSKYSSGVPEVMLDRNGNPTSDYPHVHVIHDEPGNTIRMHITRAPGVRTDHLTLPGSSSGNEVNAAVEDLLRRM